MSTFSKAKTLINFTKLSGTAGGVDTDIYTVPVGRFSEFRVGHVSSVGGSPRLILGTTLSPIVEVSSVANFGEPLYVLNTGEKVFARDIKYDIYVYEYLIPT